jgi:hypothetical protein
LPVRPRLMRLLQVRAALFRPHRRRLTRSWCTRSPKSSLPACAKSCRDCRLFWWTASSKQGCSGSSRRWIQALNLLPPSPPPPQLTTRQHHHHDHHRHRHRHFHHHDHHHLFSSTPTPPPEHTHIHTSHALNCYELVHLISTHITALCDALHHARGDSNTWRVSQTRLSTRRNRRFKWVSCCSCRLLVSTDLLAHVGVVVGRRVDNIVVVVVLAVRSHAIYGVPWRVPVSSYVFAVFVQVMVAWVKMLIATGAYFGLFLFAHRFTRGEPNQLGSHHSTRVAHRRRRAQVTTTRIRHHRCLCHRVRHVRVAVCSLLRLRFNYKSCGVVFTSFFVSLFLCKRVKSFDKLMCSLLTSSSVRVRSLQGSWPRHETTRTSSRKLLVTSRRVLNRRLTRFIRATTL